MRSMNDNIHTALVKWWSAEKGYGFLVLENGIEAFCHWSAIQGDDYRNLEEGQTVEFELDYDNPKGPCAVRNSVRPLEEPDSE